MTSSSDFRFFTIFEASIFLATSGVKSLVPVERELEITKTKDPETQNTRISVYQPSFLETI